jgi:hypothetical protein
MTLPDYLEVLTPGRSELSGRAPASATTTVASRSGVRKVVVRNHVLLSDWNIEGVAYDLGPSADELFAVALGASVTESILGAAAAAALPIEELTVATSLHDAISPGDVVSAPRVEIAIAVTRAQTDVVRALVDEAVRSARVVQHLRTGSEIELILNVR